MSIRIRSVSIFRGPPSILRANKDGACIFSSDSKSLANFLRIQINGSAARHECRDFPLKIHLARSRFREESKRDESFALSTSTTQNGMPASRGRRATARRVRVEQTLRLHGYRRWGYSLATADEREALSHAECVAHRLDLPAVRMKVMHRTSGSD